MSDGQLPTAADSVPTPAADDGVEVGQVLANRYRLRRPIGRGGMGSVWEAEHTQLGTPVAIKIIRAELAAGDRARARFVREARSAASLRSPHVVQVLDSGVDDGTPYIAMELLEGRSLREALRADGRLTPQALLDVVRAVCRALTKAHRAGIVHRDLKPDNIFITDDDEPVCKVLDFGIAKGLPVEGDNAETRTGAMVGTPHYMSPEQARDSAAAVPASDLWSVAVIAYECLVGQRPFEGSSVATLSVKILVDDIPVPSEHAEVPAGFDAWFARATQRDPDARFGSARQLCDALAGALGLDAEPLTVSEAAPTTQPKTSGGGAAIVAVAVVAVGGALWWWSAEPAARSHQPPAPEVPSAAGAEPTTPPPVASGPPGSTTASIAAADVVDTAPEDGTTGHEPAHEAPPSPKRPRRPQADRKPSPPPPDRKVDVEDLEF